MTKAEFLSAIRGGDVDKRFAAWRAAGEMDASVVPELVDLNENSDPGVAKAAGEALTTMTHAVGKDLADPKRAPLAQAFASKPTLLTLRLLSNIGGDAEVPAIAKSLSSAALREEAIFALERIPGAFAEDAILNAYASATDDFKPRILYALGHRRVKKAAAICARAMASNNPGIKAAGEWALGRIGPAGVSAMPQEPHAQLRYIEGVLAQGNRTLALSLYKKMLERPEEHLQCAALVGLGKVGTADAAQAVFPKLKSADRKVRITAQQVWNRFAGA
jgi:hypothetical protein